jgi:hypothetical protein
VHGVSRVQAAACPGVGNWDGSVHWACGPAPGDENGDSHISHLAKLRHTEPGVHETRDAPRCGGLSAYVRVLPVPDWCHLPRCGCASRVRTADPGPPYPARPSRDPARLRTRRTGPTRCEADDEHPPADGDVDAEHTMPVQVRDGIKSPIILMSLTKTNCPPARETLPVGGDFRSRGIPRSSPDWGPPGSRT